MNNRSSNTTAHSRSLTRSALAGLAGAVVLVGLTGCVPERQATQISLLNRTQNKITARVVLRRYNANDQTLARRSLKPGQTAAMGPFVPADGSLRLLLLREDQFADTPISQSLRPGLSSWEIVTPIFSVYSSIELRPVANEKPDWVTVAPRRGYRPCSR